MAKFNTDTLSLFHTFSKTQVNSDAKKPQFSSLGNTVNKSGHTVQSNEIWTEAIPFFGLGIPADFSSTAQVNDLVKDADGVIWQRNDTPYTDANGTYWTQKTKSITSFTKGRDGKYTFTEEDGALVDGSYLLNAAGVPTVKYHSKKQLTPLVSDNNAFIDSENDASRLKIDGKWVEQFIGVTDVYVNGSAAVSYAPVLFSDSSSTTPLKAGAGEDYLDYCATGIILWDKSECTGNEVISCFEYVGAKLDASLTNVSDEIKSAKDAIAVIEEQLGLGNTGEEGTTESLGGRVSSLEEAVDTLNGDENTTGSVAHSVKGLADTQISNESTSEDTHVTVTLGGSVGAPTVTVTTSDIASKTALETLEAKVDTLHETGVSYKVLSELPAPSAAYKGVIALIPTGEGESAVAGGYVEWLCVETVGENDTKTYSWQQIGTTNAELTQYATTESVTQAIGELETSLVGETGKVTVLQGKVKTIEETTVPALQQAIADAEAAAKEHTDEELSKALEQIDKEIGDVDTKVTNLTTEHATDKAALEQAIEGAKTAASTALSEAKTELEGKIAAAQSAGTTAAAQALAAAQAAQQTADAKISSVTEGTDSSLLTVSTEGTAVTITLDGDVATKTNISETALTGSGESSDNHVKVTLGGNLGEQTVTVETKDIASAAELAELVNTVNSHIEKAAGLYLSVEKVDTLPETGETNKIYLLPLATDKGREENIHTEYIWTNGKWQVIGTTAIDINNLEKAAQTAQAAADKAQGEVDALETTVSTLSQLVGDIEERVTTAEGEIDTLQGQVEALTTGDAQAITTVTGDTYVKATKSGSTVTLETQIAAIDSKLAEEDSAVSGKIKTVETNAAQALADTKTELNAKITGVSETVADLETSLEESIQAVDGKSLAATSTGGTYVTVNTEGTVGEGLSVTVDDTALTTTVNKASSAVQGIKVNGATLSKDANNVVNIPVATHSNGTWTNSSNLVTGATVSSAITTAKTQVLETNITTETAKDDATYPKVTVQLSGTVQTPKLTVTTDDIASAEALTKVSQTVASLAFAHAADKAALEAQIKEVSQTVTADKAVLEQGIEEAKAAAQTAQQTADNKLYSLTINDSTGTITKSGATVAPTLTVNAGAINSTEKKFVSGKTVYTAINTLKTTQVTANQAVTGSGISVTLGGTVGSPTLTGSVTPATYTPADGETAGSWSDESNVVTGATVKAAIADVATAHQKDIDTVTAAIESLSTSGFQRIVVDSLESVTDIKLNAIYLVPFTSAEKDENVYAEYIYVGGSVTDGVVGGGRFEQIGTTKTDLAEYAKTSEVTSKIEELDADLTVNGISVKQVDGKVTELTETLITASVPEGTTSVEGNIAYVGSTKNVIAPEKFQTAAQMPATLTSWVADLSNLTVGDGMFNGCTGLVTFIGDLGSLTSGVDMFAGCQLSVESVEFIADTLPTVESGTITLGNTTEEHAEAIAEIEAKGWTVA